MTPFRPFLPWRTASFPSFDRKKYGPIRRKWTSKWLIPRRHNKWKHQQMIKDISIQEINTIIHLENNLRYGKIKFIIQKDSWLHAASIKTTVWNKLGVFPSPFHVSTSSGLTLTGAFCGGYVTACSTAFRSATEENDSGGYLHVPCPSKMKQSRSTADWLNC